MSERKNERTTSDARPDHSVSHAELARALKKSNEHIMHAADLALAEGFDSNAERYMDAAAKNKALLAKIYGDEA